MVLWYVHRRPDAQAVQRCSKHLLVQLDLQPLWDFLQQIDVALLNPHLEVAVLLQDLLDFAIEAHGQLPVVEELEKLGLVGRLLAAGGPQRGHGGGNGGDARREEANGQQDHNDREGPFQGVVRGNVIRRRSELSQSPV